MRIKQLDADATQASSVAGTIPPSRGRPVETDGLLRSVNAVRARLRVACVYCSLLIRMTILSTSSLLGFWSGNLATCALQVCRWRLGLLGRLQLEAWTGRSEVRTPCGTPEMAGLSREVTSAIGLARIHRAQSCRRFGNLQTVHSYAKQGQKNCCFSRSSRAVFLGQKVVLPRFSVAFYTNCEKGTLKFPACAAWFLPPLPRVGTGNRMGKADNYR